MVIFNNQKMLLLKGLRNFTKYGKNSRNFANIKFKDNVPDRVFSGIQPTGSVHLGNYLGAISQWVKLQNSGQEVILSIVDLHAMTLSFDPKELSKSILEVTATLLACGVDPNKTILFQQSNIHQHTELWRYLRTVSTMARLAHLPQFKTKSSTLQDVPLALYFYPVLQSADILLYKATSVPVGEDQLQHIQLCRELARMFNKRYGRTFPIPQAIISDDAVSKIKSLRDPLKKMSKSDSNSDSRISLTDSPDDIAHKIKGAVCGNNSKITLELEGNPEISNLVFIHSMLSGKPVESICKEYEGLDILRYKSLLTDCVIEHLTPIRTKLLDFIVNPEYLISALEDGANKASKVASMTMQEVNSKLNVNHSNVCFKNHQNILKQNDSPEDTILLGLEATGNIHLGNYLNTINECAQLQNLGKNVMLSIEDSTKPCEPKVQRKNILETTATLLACGIDPNKSVLFQQSRIYHHNELCWHTTCIATMARLSQLPQFKDKFLNLEDIPVEVFMHPISQTVDILLYKATRIPSGGYPIENLQLAQDIAKVFNQKYGLTFPIPQFIKTDGMFKIRSLKDPTKEMDNSDSNPKSIIYLTDSPDVIVKKIKGAMSDFNSKITYEPKSRQGISNLIQIHSLLSKKSVEDICKECEELDTLQYKLQLAECVIEHLTPIRTKLMDLRANPDYLLKVLEDGAEKASEVAQVTTKEVYFKLGLQLGNISSNKKKVVL